MRFGWGCNDFSRPSLPSAAKVEHPSSILLRPIGKQVLGPDSLPNAFLTSLREGCRDCSRHSGLRCQEGRRVLLSVSEPGWGKVGVATSTSFRSGNCAEREVLDEELRVHWSKSKTGFQPKE